MASEVYRSMGKPKISFYIQLAYLIIYIPIIYISAQKGFNTLSIVSCLIRLIPVVVDLIALDRLFKIQIKVVLQNVGYVLFATLCMSMIALVVHGPEGSIIRQFLTIGLCILAYTVILMLNKKFRTIIISIFKRKEEQ